jgi:hypothetical protein
MELFSTIHFFFFFFFFFGSRAFQTEIFTTNLFFFFFFFFFFFVFDFVGAAIIQSGGLTRQLIGWQRRVSCMAF